MKFAIISLAYYIGYGAIQLVNSAHAITKSGNPKIHWLFTGNMPLYVLIIALTLELLVPLFGFIKKRVNDEDTSNVYRDY